MSLLDEEGLDGLTTRKLGAALSVRGSALYRHFPSKEALLEAVADRLVEGVGAPLGEGSWEEQLTNLAGRLRASLLAHRDGARLVAGTYVTGPQTRMVGDAIFEVLQRAGMAPDEAGWVAFTLGHYVLGHTIEEQAQADLTAAGAWTDKVTAFKEREDRPFVRAAIAGAFDIDPSERFAFGLELFLSGVREQIARSGENGGVLAGTGRSAGT